MLLKIEFFETKKEIIIYSSIILLIFLFNLYLEYNKYSRIKTHGYKTIARVDNIYFHPHKTILKLTSKDHFTFYTRAKNITNKALNHYVTVKLYAKYLTFLSFLKTSYIPSYILKVDHQDNFKSKIVRFIKKQHTSSVATEIYEAIFLAQPVSHKTRVKVNKIGVSHLIAISGFHITFLFTCIYAIFFFIYRVLLKNYFLTRHKDRDMTLVIFLLLLVYLYLLNFTPATVRAFAMMILSFFMFDRFIEIFSFTNLALVVSLIIAFDVQMLFSLSFFLSISGVFIIFVFLKHFKNFNSIVEILLFNPFIYILITPITLYFFHNLYITQLLSIPLSLLFFVFYPLTIILHLFNYGNLLDPLLLKLLSVNATKIVVYEPLWYLLTYIIALIISARYKLLLYFLVILNILLLTFYFIRGLLW